VKRREALAAACDLIAEALPVLVRREDSSWSHVVGVAIEGVPCMQIDCVAHGRTRAEEQIVLHPRVAGTADETVPLFRDPPGQPEPLLPGAVLTRGGAHEYRWTGDRNALREEIGRAARARWATWRIEASEVFARSPRGWADACERVAALEDPLRWMAIGAEHPVADLGGMALPVRERWLGAHWTAAWIGLGPILDRVVPCDAATAARISSAAAMIRSSGLAPGRA
jgi:hypothetical protein